MNDLTGFQRDLLFVVAGNEGTHGLGIRAEMDDYYNAEINHSRLYPNLDTLVEKGLLEKSEVDGRTNAYHITTRGRREIDARMDWQRARAETYADVEVTA